MSVSRLFFQTFCHNLCQGTEFVGQKNKICQDFINSVILGIEIL